jgi:pimeloyl-ACP methyl ester carboxylesterase
VERFGYEGFEICFEEIGRRSASDRPFVLLHGLLLSHKHHRFLAEGLAELGNRLILVDLLGHGASDHPQHSRHYSMEQFARQVVALLDHLDIAEAVVGGTSLGANTTIETAAHAPERVRAMFIEMPVLERAVPVAATVFAPLVMSLAQFSTPWNAVASLMGRVPRGLHVYWDVMLDLASGDPLANAAVIHGLLSGRIAPHPDEREKLEHDTLIIGHQRDLLHPFSDAEALHRELRNSELVQARSIFELRFSPDRLTGVIGGWLDEVWLG